MSSQNEESEKSEAEKNSESVGTTNTSNGFAALIYQQFISHVTGGSLRRGQSWMIALNDVSPGTYERISGTDADCFYDDRKIDAFKREVFRTEE